MPRLRVVYSWMGEVVDRIELADVVASLRAEVDRTWREGQYSAVGFEAGPIEVELTTEVEVVRAHGKLSAKFWVLSAEAAEAGRTRTNTQRVTFSLTPRNKRDPSRPLLIAGGTQAGERRPAVTAPRTPEQAGGASAGGASAGGASAGGELAW
jgi:hypothetical protein